jgi:hypothetical protein
MQQPTFYIPPKTFEILAIYLSQQAVPIEVALPGNSALGRLLSQTTYQHTGYQQMQQPGLYIPPKTFETS